MAASADNLLLQFVAPAKFATDQTLQPIQKALIEYYNSTLDEREKVFLKLQTAIEDHRYGFNRDIIPYYKSVIVPFFCGNPIIAADKNEKSNLSRYKEHSLDILEYLSKRSPFAYKDAILSIQNNPQSLYDFCQLIKHNNKYDKMLATYTFFNRSVVNKHLEEMGSTDHAASDLQKKAANENNNITAASALSATPVTFSTLASAASTANASQTAVSPIVDKSTTPKLTATDFQKQNVATDSKNSKNTIS